MNALHGTFLHTVREKMFDLTNTWVAESGDLCELKASGGYKVRPCFKNLKKKVC